jgi:hypothetical protein
MGRDERRLRRAINPVVSGESSSVCDTSGEQLNGPVDESSMALYFSKTRFPYVGGSLFSVHAKSPSIESSASEVNSGVPGE